MSQFIGLSMRRGYAGDLTRGYYDHTIESRMTDGSVKAFGVPVKISGDKVAATSATSDVVYGFAVRNYGQVDMAGVQDMSAIGVLRRGYLAVKSTGGTPAFGGKVYLDASGQISADQSSNTEIPGAIFMGAADADGLAEIAYNI